MIRPSIPIWLWQPLHRHPALLAKALSAVNRWRCCTARPNRTRMAVAATALGAAVALLVGFSSQADGVAIAVPWLLRHWGLVGAVSGLYVMSVIPKTQARPRSRPSRVVAGGHAAHDAPPAHDDRGAAGSIAAGQTRARCRVAGAPCPECSRDDWPGRAARGADGGGSRGGNVGGRVVVESRAGGAVAGLALRATTHAHRGERATVARVRSRAGRSCKRSRGAARRTRASCSRRRSCPFPAARVPSARWPSSSCGFWCPTCSPFSGRSPTWHARRLSGCGPRRSRSGPLHGRSPARALLHQVCGTLIGTTVLAAMGSPPATAFYGGVLWLSLVALATAVSLADCYRGRSPTVKLSLAVATTLLAEERGHGWGISFAVLFGALHLHRGATHERP